MVFDALFNRATNAQQQAQDARVPPRDETRFKMPATAADTAHKVNLTGTWFDGRYRLASVLISNGSAAPINYRDPGGGDTFVSAGQPLEPVAASGELSFSLTPVGAAVNANEVQVVLKWERI